MDKIQRIIMRLSAVLNKEQLTAAEIIISEELYVQETQLTVNNRDNEYYIRIWIANKTIEGLSENTLKQYSCSLRRILEEIDKPVVYINEYDVKKYLARKWAANISVSSYNNDIRYLSAFFGFMYAEEIINKNPMVKIKSAKVPQLIKPVIEAAEFEQMKHVAGVRDLALIETLYSTGCRVSEIVKMNISDINNDSAVIIGKGNKQRKVYFGTECIFYIQKYLESRKDNNPALFVSSKYPYNRLSRSAIEYTIRKLGQKIGVREHPHKFRRTLATDTMRKGMPIQEVQRMLGHSKIETTMIYCTLDDENVRNSHHRFVG